MKHKCSLATMPLLLTICKVGKEVHVVLYESFPHTLERTILWTDTFLCVPKFDFQANSLSCSKNESLPFRRSQVLLLAQWVTGPWCFAALTSVEEAVSPWGFETSPHGQLQTFQPVPIDLNRWTVPKPKTGCTEAAVRQRFHWLYSPAQEMFCAPTKGAWFFSTF